MTVDYYSVPTDMVVEKRYSQLYKEAKQTGYNLNPDVRFAKDLVRGIIINEQRYGYGSCPCRLSDDNKEEDLDIICPCNYRDADVTEFGACYCALYVSGDVIKGKKGLGPVPERRPTPEARKKAGIGKAAVPSTLSVPVWRCVVCGYLCGRDAPPEICPICKAKKERFERFM
jgi:ferredoxin-thioredoxin reductase catalytic subunit